MSIYKLRNETGTEQLNLQLGETTYTFPSGSQLDLIDDIGLTFEDLLGSKGGHAHDSICNLIRTGDWFLNDGDKDYLKEQALHILKYGNSLNSKDVTRKGKTVVSHDFAKKASWSQTATQVLGKILTRVSMSSDSYVSDETEGCWVNLESGLVYQEYKLLAQLDKTVKVYVNDVLVGSKNYDIMHMEKSVTFKNTYVVPMNAVIKADYWLTSDSFWELALDVNCLTRIVKTEAQFNRNIKLSKKLSMEVIADHPQLPDPVVLDKWEYKGIRDYMAGSSMGFTLPSFGGTEELGGYLEDTITLKFDYIIPLELPTHKFIESQGLSSPRVRCYVDGHKPIDGLFTTITFYLDTVEL